MIAGLGDRVNTRQGTRHQGDLNDVAIACGLLERGTGHLDVGVQVGVLACCRVPVHQIAGGNGAASGDVHCASVMIPSSEY